MNGTAGSKFKISAPKPTLKRPALEPIIETVIEDDNHKIDRKNDDSLFNLCDARFCLRKRNRSSLTRLTDKVLSSISSKVVVEKEEKIINVHEQRMETSLTSNERYPHQYLLLVI